MSQAGATSETDHLLPHPHGNSYTFNVGQTSTEHDSSRKQKLGGLFSTVFLIFNGIVGAGIFATPSAILRSVGSVGNSFLLWTAGALLAFMGTIIYIELGTGIPKNGGEKNYLKFMYRRPPFLVVCLFATKVLLVRNQAANSIVFGEYIVHALSLDPSRFNVRGIAFLCLTFCFLAHGATPTIGVRLQNFLGVFKLFILFAIGVAGLFCLMGVPGFEVDGKYEAPNNYNWENFWEGSTNASANSIVVGLFTVLWSFDGYSYVNLVLGDVQDPVQTVQIAAPLGMLLVFLTYMIANLGYYAVVAKNDVLHSERILGALFFRNLWGPATDKLLAVIIALSVLGNLLASFFTEGRVIQELGRDKILPASSLFTNDNPVAGLFVEYAFSVACMLPIPPGDVYLFFINLSMYTTSIIHLSISIGLLLLCTSWYQSWNWNPPFRAPKIVKIICASLEVLLVTAPLLPPTPETETYISLPYWSHVVGAGVLGSLGYMYWYFRYQAPADRLGYKLDDVQVDEGLASR